MRAKPETGAILNDGMFTKYSHLFVAGFYSTDSETKVVFMYVFNFFSHSSFNSVFLPLSYEGAGSFRWRQR